MLTRRAIEEFRAIYQTKYGVTLADAEAAELAASLLSLCRLVLTQNVKGNVDHDNKPTPAP